MKAVIFTLLGLALLFFAAIYFCQARFIYFPRKYHSSMEGLGRVEAVSFRANGKKQFLYLPKRNSGEPPETIWWLFGGNGSVALDWLGLVEAVDQPRTAFVLFDYPGYGYNEGKPGPDSIAESIEAALTALETRWKITEQEILQRSRSAGHSLGGAVALDFANRHGLNHVIAISPFTTMAAMARQQMGPAVVPLLRHRYDNEKSIDALLQSGRDIEITIFHGDADSLIPSAMGRSLADRDESGKRIQFHSVPGAGHNDIVGAIGSDLVKVWSR